MKKFKVIQATVATAMAVSMFGLTACDLFTGGNETGDGQTYSVSLNVNGGSLLSELDSYVSGEVTALPNAEKEHYTFGGWYKRSSFGQCVYKHSQVVQRRRRILGEMDS